MASFLSKQRTRESFDSRLNGKAPGTRKGYETVFNNFERFCQDKYSRNMETVIGELKISSEDEVWDLLQDWLNWNDHLAPSTLKLRFSFLNNYLHFRGIKLDSKDISYNLTFPKRIKEERFPLELKHIEKIFSIAKFRKKVLYLCQLSSGMRIGELLQLKKKNIEFGKKRLVVHIPVGIAKFNQARTTFFSNESQKLLLPIIKKLDDDDLIFGHPGIPVDSARNTEEQVLVGYLKKVGLDMRYESTGWHKITTHSFRAYFIQKVSRHDNNYAHFLAGHDSKEVYLPQYDRMTLDEKLQKYLEFEPDLIIDNSQGLQLQNEKLEKEKSENQIQKTQFKNIQEENKRIIAKIERLEISMGTKKPVL